MVGPRLRHEWALIRRHWDIVASLSLLAVTLITERVLRPAVPPVMRLPRLFSLLAVTSTAYLSRQLALQRLLAETRLRRLQRTHQAALRIGAQVSLPAVVATTADEARQLSGAAWALVHLTDPLPGVETPHLHGPLTPGVLAGSPWLADLATRVRDRGPLWLSDWRRDPSLRAAAPPGLPAGSLLAVPLLSGTRSLGVLILGNKPDDAGFTADDAAILTLLAAHAALALERTRLYAEAQQRAAELLEERERREMLLKRTTVHTRLQALIDSAKANTLSLAVFKPTKVLGFVSEEDAREWDAAKLAEMRNRANQGELFAEETWRQVFQVIPKLPYSFSYRFTDADGRESEMEVLDWETGALYWNCLRSCRGDEQAALAKVRAKYLDEFLQTDLHFFVGTTQQFHFVAPNPWVIVGVFPIPHERQMDLL